MKRLLELLYPSRALCLICGDMSGQEASWLCGPCREALQARRDGAFEAEDLDPAWTAFHYAGPAGMLARQLKYQGRTALAEFMAGEMARGLEELHVPEEALIVPVPMHARRLKQRGFNQAALLAEALAGHRGLTCVHALTRLRDTPQQAKLSGEARRANLTDAFRADGAVNGRIVVLVDDVFTTGSTARECAKALKSAGAERVLFIGFARGDGQ